METRVSSRGQIVLPKALRERDHIRPGQRFTVERLRRGEFVMRALSDSPSQDMVDILLACPTKDYFEPIASELTSDL